MKTSLACLAIVIISMLASASLRAQPVTNARVVTVSGNVSDGADYTSLKGALDHITSASSSNPYVILVYPWIYTGCDNGGGLAW